MSKLTNRTLWLAGAFNHKRQPVRPLSADTTANWQGIVAQAKCVLLDGDCLILIIAAAKQLKPEPSKHDILNAGVSSLVFRKQECYRAYPKTRTYLQDENGSRFEVIPDLVVLEKQIRTRFSAPRKNEPSNTPIPSPLACFLLRQP